MQRISYASPSGEMFDQNFQRLEQENLYFPTFPPMPTGPLQVESEDKQVVSEAECYEREEYSKMCKMWKEMTKTGIIYPVPVSLSVYIPADHFIPTPSMRNVNPKKDPPIASASLDLFNHILSGDSIIDQTVQGLRNTQIPISEYIKDEKRWGSALIPMEPNPNLYPDYVLYKNALQLWSTNTECEINDSSDLVQYGLPLTDYQPSSLITHGLKFAKSELTPIPKSKKRSNSFNPDFFKQIIGNKKPELFGEKRYFLKSSFPFLFDKKSASRSHKQKHIRYFSNSKLIASDNLSLDSFENGLYLTDLESISELQKYSKFPNIPPNENFPSYKVPKQITVGFQYSLRCFLEETPAGYEYALFHFVCTAVNLFPSQMIPLLSVDPRISPVAKVAELYCNYGLVYCNIFPFELTNLNLEQSFKNLLIFLYGIQTLYVLRLFYSREKSKKLIDLINKQASDIKKSCSDFLNNNFSQIESDLIHTDTNAIHLLIEYFPIEFANKFESFLSYLGSLDSKEFGHIAAHIFERSGSPPSVPQFVRRFIENSTSYIKNYRLIVACGEINQHQKEYQSFTKVCYLLSYILKFKNNEKVDVSPDAVMSMLGAVNQLASINSKIAAPLATSIFSFFTRKIDCKGYKTMKDIFINSVMTIFEYHDLSHSILIELFYILQGYLKVSTYEVFENFFVQILIDKMTSDNNKISREAWRLFRNIACSEFAKKISKSPEFKNRIDSIPINKLTIPAKLILLLIVKKSLLELPSSETYKPKNVVLIASMFNHVDANALTQSIIKQPKFKYENKIVQTILNGK